MFAAVFGGPSPFRHLNLPAAARSYERPESDGSPQPQGRSADSPGDLPSGLRVSDAVPAAADSDEPLVEGPAVHRVASATERLSGRDFTELSPAELRQLVTLMREMALAIPPRRTRRFRTARDGKRPDLRRTLRLARRTGGEAIRFARRAPRVEPRRLVVLCDISGSMEPYARALLMLLYVLNAGQPRSAQNRPEVFSFATRLTRLTPALAAASPDTMLAKAGEAAPDWSGGTRIGAAVKEFNDHYGSRGMARGAVVLIISDGWETGDPAAARRADGPAVPGGAPDRLGEPAHPVAPLPSRRSAAWPPPGPTATPWSARTTWTRWTTCCLPCETVSRKISRWRAKRVRAIG